MYPQTKIAALNRFLNSLREIHPQIAAHQIQILLEIAQRPVSTMQELADATDVALSSISRNLDALGEVHRSRKPGLGLVAKDWDPREPRRMVAWLTPKGRQVVGRLLDTVGP